MVSREEAEERRAGFPTRYSGEIAGRNARAPLSLFFDKLLEAKVRELIRATPKVIYFCAIPQVLAFLKDYIVFAEKLNK